jgi:hypothetical protein
VYREHFRAAVPFGDNAFRHTTNPRGYFVTNSPSAVVSCGDSGACFA